MQRIRLSLIIVSVGMVMAFLGGCGPTPPNALATTTTTTPSLTAPSTRSGKTGVVTLQTNVRLYQAEDTISVTVTNQSHQTIYFADHLTNCTVILLQREKIQPRTNDIGAGQGGSNPCPLALATRVHSLRPGERLVVKLIAPKNGWLSGLYRAMLSYRSSLTARPITTISSPVFAIGPLVPQP